jgi:hypothetical protein
MSEKMVCIKDDGYDPVHTLWIREFPVKGRVYTVRKRVHSRWGMGLLLEEIVNPIMPNGAEPNFARSRFRPATEEDLQTQITAYATEEN